MGCKTLLLFFLSFSLSGPGGIVVRSRGLNIDLRRSQDKMQGSVVLGEESLGEEQLDGVVKTDYLWQV